MDQNFLSENNSYRFSRQKYGQLRPMYICDWKEVQTSSSKWVLNIIVKSCKKLKSLIHHLHETNPSHMPCWKNSVYWMAIPTLIMESTTTKQFENMFVTLYSISFREIGVKIKWSANLVHPGRLTWTIIMEVWKIIFLSKWVICGFHVNLPGCNDNRDRKSPK